MEIFIGNDKYIYDKSKICFFKDNKKIETTIMSDLLKEYCKTPIYPHLYKKFEFTHTLIANDDSEEFIMPNVIEKPKEKSGILKRLFGFS